MKALADAVSTVWAESSDVVSGALGALASIDPQKSNWFQLKNIIEDQMDMENKLRRESFDLLRQQTEAEIRYMDAKTDALLKNEGLITIQADGLEPEIEAFMWRILEKIQIRANEESAEFLLGV